MQVKPPIAALLLLFLLRRTGALTPNPCFNAIDCPATPGAVVGDAFTTDSCCNVLNGLSFMQASDTCLNCADTTVTFSPGIVDPVDEGGSVTSLMATFTPILSSSIQPSSFLVNVVVDPNSMDTATAADFTLNSSLPLMVVNNMVTIDFDIDGDSLLEGEEFFTFSLEIDGSDSTGITLLPNIFTVDIMDDTSGFTPTFTIMDGFTLVDNLLLEESSEGVTFCVSIAGPSMLAVDVVVPINIGSSNLEADDIRILRDNITIETTSVSFMQCEPLFDIIDDANYEFSEFVNVTANVDDFDLDMTLTFGVIDPEDAMVELDRAVYVVEEGNCFNPALRLTTPMSTTGTAKRDVDDFGVFQECLTIAANVLPGDGKSGAVSEDFNTTMVVFEIPLGATNDELIFSTDSICLLDNSELHGNITFTVEIVPVPIAFQLGEQNSSTVVFQDDDEGAALVLLTISQSNVGEGSQFTLDAEVVFAGTIRNLSVYLPLVPVFLHREGLFAAEAADIINLDEAFFHFECFTEGAVDGISVTPMGNDGLFEGPELIGFTLYEASNIDGAMVFGNTVEIVIDDADTQSNLLSVSSSATEVDECGNNFAEVCVQLDNPTTIANPFTVELIVFGLTDATLGVDFELGIVPPEGCPLSPFNSGPVPPNAPAGPDPTATSLFIDFLAGNDLEFCGFISILDDDIFEAEEQIILSIDDTSPYEVFIGTNSQSTTVINKDIKDAVLSLSSIAIRSATEGDMLDICFVLETDGPIECSIEATLMANPDVELIVDTISFTFGNDSGDSACFSITIAEDSMLEGQEVVVLEAVSEGAIISSIFDPIGDATGEVGDALLDCMELMGDLDAFTECIEEIGDPHSTVHRNSTFIPLVLTDGDTEGVNVSFDSMEDMGLEVNGDFTVPVSLVGLGVTDLVVILSVCINVVDAKLGTLYKHTVEIMPGMESGDLVIPIMNDEVFGATKVFTATIESSDPSLEIGPNGTITITIEDNEVVMVNLVSPSVTVGEGDPEGNPAAEVCVALSNIPIGGTACDIVITLDFTEDTALSGDFDGSPLNLTIAAGMMPEMAICFDAQTILFDDDIIEGTESFLVEIMSVSPPEVMIMPGQTQVFIQDEDVTKVGFEDLEVTLLEDADTVINVTFDRTLEKPVTVSYSLEDVVESGNNEPPLSGILVIGANAGPDNPIMSGIAQFTITVGPDLFKEAVEVFALGLQSDDECVCLGRDLSLAITPANGGVDVFITAMPHIAVNESEGLVKICVEVDHPIQSTFEVLLSTVDDTATGGEDFEAIDEKSLIFAPGFGLIRCVHIPILPDDCLERMESFNVTLSADHIGVQFTNDEVTVYIIEDDVTKVGFEEREYTQVEGENTYVCITFDKKLEKEIVVKYFLENSSALNFENNEPAECGVLIIGEEASPDSPLESGKVCFNISMNEDLFKEAIEVFTLSLESEDPCVWLGRDQALLSVQENGEVTVGITSELHVRVNESAGFVKICVEADHESQTTYEVVFTTVEGTATAGEDYVSVTKSLLFALGFELIQCVHIPILPDDCLEVTESFNVSLSADHKGIEFAVQEITVYIMEDDVTKVGFEELTYTLVEGEDSSVCIEFDRKLEKSISVSYLLTNIASLGTKEVMQSGDLVIGENASPENPFEDREFCFDLGVAEDSIKEGREIFTLGLLSDDDCVCLGRDGAIVEVLANGNVTVSVASASHIQVTESTGFVEVCLQADHLSQATFEVTLISEDVTAIDGEDYIGLNKSLVFSFGFGTVECVHIPILNDECYEDFMQSFNILLSSEQDCVNFDVTEFPVYILDDDYVYLSFDEEILYVEEDVGVVDICLVLSNVTGVTKDPLPIDVFSVSSSAMPPSDFEVIDITVTFPAGRRRMCFPLNIADDLAFEKTEEFSLVLVDVSEDDNIQLHIDTLAIHIRDDDIVYLSFNDSQIYVDESEGVVNVCLELRNVSEPTQAQIWADIVSNNGSAIAGSDFMDVETTVIFPPNSMDGSSYCFSVPISDNMAFEKVENFSLHIVAVEENVVIHLMYLTIFIHDDDYVYLSFPEEFMYVQEAAGDLSVCLELSNVLEPTQSQIWADVSSVESSARAGFDFLSVETTVIFSVGGMNGSASCFDVVILNDTAFEKTEYFSLQIVSAEDNVHFESHISNFTIHIHDDDYVSLSFSQESIYVDEDQGTFDVCLALSNVEEPTESPIWATVASIDNSISAIAGADYISVAATVIVPANSVNGGMGCFEVTIEDNLAFEKTEEFSLNITDVEDNVHLIISMLTINIHDDDAVSLLFTEDTYSVMEGDSDVLATVCLELSGANAPTEVAIWANVSTADISATDGLDYTGVDMTLSLGANSNNGDQVCLNITIMTDELSEGFESFSVMALLDAGVVPASDSAIVEIEDMEECIPMFIDDTPRVDGVEVTIVLPSCVQSPQCSLSSNPNNMFDCTQQVILVSRNGLQTLTIDIPSLGPEATLVRQFRRDNPQCAAHAINQGLVENGDGTATIMFEGTGPDSVNPVTNFDCTIENVDESTGAVSVLVAVQPCTTPTFTFPIPAGVTGLLQVSVRPVPGPQGITTCSRLVTRPINKNS